MDLTFAHGAWLWALLVLPVVALLEARAVRRAGRAVAQLAGPVGAPVLLAQCRPGERRTGALLRLGALALLAFGAAGPQWGREAVRRTSSGSDVVLAMDVSASMDTRDVLPTRLDEARREALELMDHLGGSRVGVVAFAGDAVRLCPLTQDHAATRLVLQSLASGSVSTPGTDLGRALDRALEMLPPGRREEQAIVLWTDGEDLEGRARSAIARVRSAGMRVFAVGVGTALGDVVPVTDEHGRVIDMKRDASGGIVRSELDERLLRDLARATHGAYFGAAGEGAVGTRLARAMGALARSRRGAHVVERPVARFGWCALGAALLLAAELVRPRRRMPAARARAAAAIAAAALLVCLAPRARAQSAWARGDRAFRERRWAAAESLYTRRVRAGGPAAVRVDLATVQALRGRGAGAERELSHLAAQEGRTGQVASYNLGTLLGEKKDYDHALGELRRALERDPDDDDARWNYELLAREREAAAAAAQPKQPSPAAKQPSDPGTQGRSGAKSAPPPAAPQPAGGASGPSPAPAQSQEPAPAGGRTGMSRRQAEQLLGSLQELERLEKRRAHAAHGGTDRKGKDW